MYAPPPWSIHLSQHFRDEWMDQGGGAYIVLVDREGTIAYADYHKDIPPHWGPKAVSFPYEFLTIRMNHLESRLASFFANGARYGKTIETAHPPWRLPKERDAATLSKQYRFTLWMPAKVVDVDATSRKLTVERSLPTPDAMKGVRFWEEAGDDATAFDPAVKARLDTVRGWGGDARGHAVSTLLVGDTTDIFVNGRPHAFAALQCGDRVGICCVIAGPDGRHAPRPLQIRAYRFR